MSNNGTGSVDKQMNRGSASNFNFRSPNVENRAMNSLSLNCTTTKEKCYYKSPNTFTDIHIPVGSNIIPLQYQPEAWMALKSLRVS